MCGDGRVRLDPDRHEIVPGTKLSSAPMAASYKKAIVEGPVVAAAAHAIGALAGYAEPRWATLG